MAISVASSLPADPICRSISFPLYLSFDVLTYTVSVDVCLVYLGVSLVDSGYLASLMPTKQTENEKERYIYAKTGQMLSSSSGYKLLCCLNV